MDFLSKLGITLRNDIVEESPFRRDLAPIQVHVANDPLWFDANDVVVDVSEPFEDATDIYVKDTSRPMVVMRYVRNHINDDEAFIGAFVYVMQKFNLWVDFCQGIVTKAPLSLIILLFGDQVIENAIEQGIVTRRVRADSVASSGSTKRR